MIFENAIFEVAAHRAYIYNIYIYIYICNGQNEGYRTSQLTQLRVHCYQVETVIVSSPLKRQCHEIFSTIFLLKSFDLGQI